jgi:hypothetical protein
MRPSALLRRVLGRDIWCNTSRPVRPDGRVTGSGACVKERGVVVVRLGWQGLEAALAAGEVCCPDSGAALRRWRYAREREVRMRHGARLVRPRRACCRRCTATHVLFPAFCVLRPSRRQPRHAFRRAIRQYQHQQPPTRSGSTSSRRAGASASRRSQELNLPAFERLVPAPGVRTLDVGLR